MEKKILYLVIISVIFIFSCSKTNDFEEINDISIENKVSEVKVQGGDFIYNEDWIGWINPDLVEEGVEIPEGEYWRGDAIYYGFKYENGIACPKEGKNCGTIYTEGENGLPKNIGVYLLTTD